MCSSNTESESIVNACHVSEDYMKWRYILENSSHLCILVRDNSVTFEAGFCLFNIMIIWMNSNSISSLRLSY